MESNEDKKMDCKYFHTSIQRSQKIIRCIALPNKSDSHECCHVLLIYRNYAQVFNVDNSHQSVQVSTVATYPLYVPITWCCIVGEHIAAVTADAHLLMLESAPPFSRVSCHQMSTKYTPSTIPVAHCAISSSCENLVACGFTENLVLATFDSEDTPSLQRMKLPDFYVYEIAPTQDPNIFAFLVSTKSGARFLIHFELYDFTEVRRARIPDDSITITSVFNEEGYSHLVLFTSDKIIIDNSEISYDVDARVYSWFFTPTGEIILQLLNQNIIGIKVDSDCLVTRGSLPLISTFCHLSNNLLLCVSEENDSFFLPISSLSIMKAGFVDFDLLPRTSIPLTPRITSAIFHGDSLVVLSGGCGDSDHYLISAIYNTISHKSDVDKDATDHLNHLDIAKDQQIRFFSAPNDCLVVSSDKASALLKGDLQISTNPTIALGTFGDSILQVHVEGLCLMNGKNYKDSSGSKVTAATIGDGYCIASFEDGTVRLFDKDLVPKVEKKIPNAHAFAFCSNNIAIAAEPLEGGNSTVTLYSLDLIPTDDVGQLTSRAHVMLFQQSSSELFVSTLNGAVSRWIIGNDFSNSCAQIYQGEIPPLLLSYSDCVLIASNETYLFNGFQLLSIGIKQLRAICSVITNEPTSSLDYRDQNSNAIEKIYVLDDTENIRIISLDVDEKDLTFRSFPLAEMPRKAAYLDKNTVICITRQLFKDSSTPKSFLVVFRHTPDIQDIELIKSIDFNKILNDHCMLSVEAITEDEIAIGFMTGDQEYILIIIKIYFDNQASNDFKIDFQYFERLPNPTFAIRKVENIIFVGIGPHLCYLRKIQQSDENSNKKEDSNESEMIQKYQLENLGVSLPSAICFIEVSNGIIWLADRIESVFAYRYSYNEKTGLVESTKLIAVDTSPRQITSMTLINENCVVIGEKRGMITIMRLPNDDIGNKNLKWRESPLPDRGISLDTPVGQLMKIASYSVSEAVTSLLVSSKGAIFYTTLLGQIGAFIPLDKDEDYLMLLNAEMVMERLSTEEFGLTISRRFPMEKICVVSSDILDLIEHLSRSSQDKFEAATKCHIQNLFGLTCMIKQRAKF